MRWEALEPEEPGESLGRPGKGQGAAGDPDPAGGVTGRPSGRMAHAPKVVQNERESSKNRLRQAEA